jgi:hypothetical protein
MQEMHRVEHRSDDAYPPRTVCMALLPFLHHLQSWYKMASGIALNANKIMDDHEVRSGPNQRKCQRSRVPREASGGSLCTGCKLLRRGQERMVPNLGRGATVIAHCVFTTCMDVKNMTGAACSVLSTLPPQPVIRDMGDLLASFMTMSKRPLGHLLTQEINDATRAARTWHRIATSRFAACVDVQSQAR